MSEQQKLAVVTGGMGGIGTEICTQLVKKGYKVVATYHHLEEGKISTWLAERADDGVEISLVAGDVSSAEDSERMVSEIATTHGAVDILVNCAGITRDKTFKKMELDDWESVINTNLNSVFYVTKHVWEGMLDRKFGRIINISSVNGQRGQFGQANYAAAKAGMHGFTMTLAQEGATKGVTVNTLSPGYVETPMTLAMRDDVRDAIISGIPMKRMARPAEIAATVVFLVSEDASYITGANIPVNGGLFIH